MEFQDLDELKFEKQMRKYITNKLEDLYAGAKCCWRNESDYCSNIDTKQGIDLKIQFNPLTYIHFQTKVRQNEFLINPDKQIVSGFPDYTQEIRNGNGERGEWYHLYAQMYFYGWANNDNTGLAAWILMDIPKYRYIVNEVFEGLQDIGWQKQNSKCGQSEFYAIPLYRISNAILAHNGLPDGWDKDWAVGSAQSL